MVQLLLESKIATWWCGTQKPSQCLDWTVWVASPFQWLLLATVMHRIRKALPCDRNYSSTTTLENQTIPKTGRTLNRAAVFALGIWALYGPSLLYTFVHKDSNAMASWDPCVVYASILILVQGLHSAMMVWIRPCILPGIYKVVMLELLVQITFCLRLHVLSIQQDGFGVQDGGFFMALAAMISVVILGYMKHTRITSNLDYISLQASTNANVDAKANSEVKAHWLSRMVFWWIYPLLRKGYQRGKIEQKDIPFMADQDRTKANVSQFEELSRRKHGRVHLVSFLSKIFAKEWLYAGLLCAISQIGSLVTPMLLEELLAVLAKDSSTTSNTSTSHHFGSSSEYGYFLAVSLFLVTSVQGLFLHQFWFAGLRVGMHMRALLLHALFEKAMKVVQNQAMNTSSTTMEKKYSVGEIVNYMSIDASRINDNFIPTTLHLSTWAAALVLGFAFYHLYRLLSVAMLLWLFIVLLLIPMNMWINQRLSNGSLVIQKVRDVRTQQWSNLLHQIHLVKAYSVEDDFETRLGTSRFQELNAMRRVRYLNALQNFIFMITQIIAPMATFALYAFLYHRDVHSTNLIKLNSTLRPPLSPALIFSSLAWFNLTSQTVWNLPRSFNSLTEMWVSLKRLQDFLNTPTDLELKSNNGVKKPDESPITIVEALPSPCNSFVPNGTILIQAMNITWPTCARLSIQSTTIPAACEPILRNVSLHVSPGEFIAVLGPTGCGKTCFLETLLGNTNAAAYHDEMPLVGKPVGLRSGCRLDDCCDYKSDKARLQGILSVTGSIAYCAQSHWLQQKTIRANILFGEAFDADWYQQTLYSCCLKEDLSKLPNGDLTRLEVNGKNLSGGQCQRLALARAVYSRRDIILFDDSLSNVDTPVATHILTECMSEQLKGSHTRILVCSNPALIEANATLFDRILLFNARGEIEALDIPQKVFQFTAAVKDEKLIVKIKKEGAVTKEASKSPSSSSTNLLLSTQYANDSNDFHATRQRSGCTLSGRLCDSPVDFKFQWIQIYLRSYGSWLLPGVMSFLLVPICFVLKSFYLSWWSDACTSTTHATVAAANAATTVTVATATVTVATASNWMRLYILMSILECGSVAINSILYLYGSIQASATISQQLTDSLLRTGLSFFDVHSGGDLLNRLVKDMASVDQIVPYILASTIAMGLKLLSHFILIAYGIPWILCCILVLLVPYYFLFTFYRRSGRDLKRLDSQLRSPILSSFEESLRGHKTILAFKKQALMLHDFEGVCDDSIQAYWIMWAANQWVTVWLEILGSSLVLASCFLSLYEHYHHRLDAGLVGMMLTYIIAVPSYLGWLFKNLAQCEVEAIALERVYEFAHEPNEYQWNHDKLNDLVESHGIPGLPSQDYLAKNVELGMELSVRNVHLKYATSQEWVLQGMSFNIPAGKKVAIVGRTGAGKSSLIHALLRLYPYEGSIFLNGVNIASIPLQTLRARLIYLIPQRGSFLGNSLADWFLSSDVHPSKHISTHGNNDLDPYQLIQLLRLLNLHFLTSRYLQSNFSIFEAHVTVQQMWNRVDEMNKSNKQTSAQFQKKWVDSVLAFLQSVHSCHDFSAGQMQQLHFTRAWLRRGIWEVLCCDEVFSTLHPAIYEKYIQLMSTFHKTILVISHQNQSLGLFDLVMELEKGKVSKLEPPLPS